MTKREERYDLRHTFSISAANAGHQKKEMTKHDRTMTFPNDKKRNKRYAVMTKMMETNDLL